MNTAYRKLLLLDAYELELVAAMGKLKRLLCFISSEYYEQSCPDSALLRLSVKGLVYERLGKLVLADELRRITDVMRQAKTGLVLTSGSPEIPQLCCYLHGGQVAVIKPYSHIPNVFGLDMLSGDDFWEQLIAGGWLPEDRNVEGTGDFEPYECPPQELEKLLTGIDCEQLPGDDRLTVLAEAYDLASCMCVDRRIVYFSALRRMTASSTEDPAVFEYRAEEMRSWLKRLSKGDKRYDIG